MSGGINAHQKKANLVLIMQSVNFLNNYFFLGWLVKQKLFKNIEIFLVEIGILNLGLP